MTADLITWLRAQLDEDYEAARLVLGVNAMADVINGKPAPRWVRDDGTSAIYNTKGIPIVRHTWAREAEHITRWDPVRVLAEVDAKRRILDRYDDALARQGDWQESQMAAHICATEYEDWVIPALTLPYADRPGYREEWKP